LQLASDNPQLMRPVIVNRLPTPVLEDNVRIQEHARKIIYLFASAGLTTA